MRDWRWLVVMWLALGVGFFLGWQQRAPEPRHEAAACAPEPANPYLDYLYVGHDLDGTP